MYPCAPFPFWERGGFSFSGAEYSDERPQKRGGFSFYRAECCETLPNAAENRAKKAQAAGRETIALRQDLCYNIMERGPPLLLAAPKADHFIGI